VRTQVDAEVWKSHFVCGFLATAMRDHPLERGGGVANGGEKRLLA
jgi:hypothetical protein